VQEKLAEDWRGQLRQLPRLDEELDEELDEKMASAEVKEQGKLRQLPRLDFHPLPLLLDQPQVPLFADGDTKAED
jgi:hypothetical protein